MAGGGYQLIDKDYRVFDFLEAFIAQHRFLPTVREIMEDLSFSASSVTASLRKLRRNGYIDYRDGKPRTIVVPRYYPTEARV